MVKYTVYVGCIKFPVGVFFPSFVPHATLHFCCCPGARTHAEGKYSQLPFACTAASIDGSIHSLVAAAASGWLACCCWLLLAGWLAGWLAGCCCR